MHGPGAVTPAKGILLGSFVCLAKKLCVVQQRTTFTLTRTHAFRRRQWKVASMEVAELPSSCISISDSRTVAVAPLATACCNMFKH